MTLDNDISSAYTATLAKLEALYRLGEEYAPQGEEDNIFSRSSLAWVKVPPGYHLSLGPIGLLALYPTSSDWSVYLCDKSNATSLCSQVPINKARSTAETYARHHASFSLISRSANWRKMPATSAQKDFLFRLGVSFLPDLSKGEAESLITRYKPLPRSLSFSQFKKKLTV
jgi:hypothetical protein